MSLELDSPTLEELKAARAEMHGLRERASVHSWLVASVGSFLVAPLTELCYVNTMRNSVENVKKSGIGVGGICTLLALCLGPPRPTLAAAAAADTNDPVSAPVIPANETIHPLSFARAEGMDVNVVLKQSALGFSIEALDSATSQVKWKRSVPAADFLTGWLSSEIVSIWGSAGDREFYALQTPLLPAPGVGKPYNVKGIVRLEGHNKHRLTPGVYHYSLVLDPETGTKCFEEFVCVPPRDNLNYMGSRVIARAEWFDGRSEEPSRTREVYDLPRTAEGLIFSEAREDYVDPESGEAITKRYPVTSGLLYKSVFQYDKTNGPGDFAIAPGNLGQYRGVPGGSREQQAIPDKPR